VLPAGFVSFKSKKESQKEADLKPILPQNNAGIKYTKQQTDKALSLANEAVSNNVGYLTIGFINSLQNSGSVDLDKSLAVKKLAFEVENKIKFKPDLREDVKSFNKGVRSAIDHWKMGGLLVYADEKGREYQCLYKDTNNVPFTIGLKDVVPEETQSADVYIDYKNKTLSYNFSDFSRDGIHLCTSIYTDFATDEILSVSIADDWSKDPVRYAFKQNKPYLAAYNTNEGRFMFYFDEDERVCKIISQKYDKSLGTLELGTPETFVKISNGRFVSLGAL